MDQQLIPSRCQVTDSKQSKYRSSLASSHEIYIDDMIIEQNLNPFSSDSLLMSSKVLPSETFNIQGAEMRFTKYYELKGKFKQQNQSFWKRCLKQKSPSPMTKLQKIEIKQRALLKDFDSKDQNKSPSFFQNILKSIGQKITVIEPDSFVYMSWQLLNSLLVLLFMFETPMMMFFDIKTSVYSMDSIVLFALLIFILDMFVSLNTAIYFQGKLMSLYEGVLVYDRNKILKSYLKTCFFQDIIPIICLSTQLIPIKHVFYYVGIFFYMKIYEIFKLQENIYNNLRLKRRSVAIYQMVQLMLWMIFICHLFACFFYGVARFEMDNNPDATTWLNKILDGKIDKSNIPQIYCYAFYWSVTTMISVGYGDITPQNPPEVLITIFTMFVSCILFAYSINSIWEVIRELNENRFKFDKHVTAINRFMYDHRVDRKLTTKINAYIAHMWNADRKRDIDAEQIMIKRLAPALREQLLFDTLGLFLQKTSFFVENFSQDFLRELATDIEEIRFSEGEVIFLQDDPQWDDLSLYFIASGSVELYLQQGTTSHQISVITKDDIFGWAGFVGGIRRTASAKCSNYSSFYKLSRVKFLQRLDAYPLDKQNFHQLRDKYLFYSTIEQFGIHCYICDSHFHLAESCDKTHFVSKGDPDTNKLVNARTTGYRRKFQPKFNALKLKQDVARDASNQQSFNKEYMKGYSHNIDDSEAEDEDKEDEEMQDVSRSIQATENSPMNQEENNDWIVRRSTGNFAGNDNDHTSQQECQSLQPFNKSFQLDDIDHMDQSERKVSYDDNNLLFTRKRMSITHEKTSETRKPSIHIVSQTRNPSVMQNKNYKSELNLKLSGQFSVITNGQSNQNESNRRRISDNLNPSNINSVAAFKRKIVNSEQNLLMHKLNMLAGRLNGESQDLIQQIRDQLIQSNPVDDEPIIETTQENFNEIDSDSAFTIDIQQNFTNYFPQSNPKKIINELRKQYKRNRRTFRI